MANRDIKPIPWPKPKPQPTPPPPQPADKPQPANEHTIEEVLEYQKRLSV